MGTASRKRKPAALVGPLTWCFLERMTRFELATLTSAKVMTTVRTVRLTRCSTPQSAKLSGKSVWSVQFVYRSTIERFGVAR